MYGTIFHILAICRQTPLAQRYSKQVHQQPHQWLAYPCRTQTKIIVNCITLSYGVQLNYAVVTHSALVVTNSVTLASILGTCTTLLVWYYVNTPSFCKVVHLCRTYDCNRKDFNYIMSMFILCTLVPQISDGLVVARSFGSVLHVLTVICVMQGHLMLLILKFDWTIYGHCPSWTTITRMCFHQHTIYRIRPFWREIRIAIISV